MTRFLRAALLALPLLLTPALTMAAAQACDCCQDHACCDCCDKGCDNCCCK
jgi:hypothetical protein